MSADLARHVLPGQPVSDNLQAYCRQTGMVLGCSHINHVALDDLIMIALSCIEYTVMGLSDRARGSVPDSCLRRQSYNLQTGQKTLIEV